MLGVFFPGAFRVHGEEIFAPPGKCGGGCAALYTQASAMFRRSIANAREATRARRSASRWFSDIGSRARGCVRCAVQR
eukprot:5280685-Alexandrium_andersonii.AAC.1